LDVDENTEVRSQKIEDGRRKSENSIQKTVFSSQKAEIFKVLSPPSAILLHFAYIAPLIARYNDIKD